MLGLTSYKEFLRLLQRHDACLEESSDVCRVVLIPGEHSRTLVCPCFPSGLTTETTQDYCSFGGVRRCDASLTLRERQWCNSGDRSFASAFRIVRDYV